MLMLGWNFEVDVLSRFWRWNLIKICEIFRNLWYDLKSYFGKENSTLESVVPLAMFVLCFVRGCAVFWYWAVVYSKVIIVRCRSSCVLVVFDVLMSRMCCLQCIICPDWKFVRKYTRPDFRTKNFTPKKYWNCVYFC